MGKRRKTWWPVGLGVLALWLGGCPSSDVGGGQNTNDNSATGNDNSSNDNSSNDNGSNDNSNGDGTGGIEAGVEITFPNEGAQHVPFGEQVTYESNPPASGPHWSQSGAAPVAAGLYESALEEEQWVHNLEHGYVVFLYDCRGPCQPALLDDLQELLNAAPPSETFGNTKLVIAPYSGLPFLFTAVAWDRQLHLDTLDQAALLDFYSRYVDQGPELVP